MPRTLARSVSTALLVLALCAPGALAQEPAATPPAAPGILPQDVSFIDFATVDVAALAALLPSSDEETLANLRRFASFEVVHDSRGARGKALEILALLDSGGARAASRTAKPAPPPARRAAARARRGGARAK